MAQRQDEGFWRGHLEGWRQSGQTQVAYCASQELNIKAFTRWRGKERRAQEESEPKLTLVPVSVRGRGSHCVMQLHSPSGWRIELAGTALDELATGLRQLP